MATTTETKRIESALADVAGLYLAVERDGDSLVVSGIVETEAERSTALDIVASFAGGIPIDDNIDVEGALPERLGSLHLAAGDVAGFIGARSGLEEHASIEPGDFAGDDLTTDPFAGSGAGPSTAEPDDSAGGGRVYVPPVDPVGTSRRVIGGFELSSLDDQPEIERSTLDGRVSDDAIAEAVLRELREDAATSDLEIQVSVRNGVVHLRGTVATIDDAENAEEVASRVEGGIRVHEMLDVLGGRIR
jgi:osmotically-inducible protein OsmY